MTLDVSVILPCLNEEHSVGQCVREAREALAAAGFSHEVIVVDNGSTDASPARATEAGARVVFEEQRGYGAACAGGYAASSGRVIVFSDADGTYPLSDTPALVEKARQDKALVLGSRFDGTIMPGAMPLLHRLVGNPGTRLLLRLLFGVRCSDPHSGIRAMSREVFQLVEPSNRAFEYTIQMVLNAHRRGVAIASVPITYRARGGESKLRALPQGWSLLRFLLLNSPAFLYVVPGLAALVLGVAGLVWLAPADRQIGPVELGVNSLLVASLATVTGYQVLTFGTCARMYGADPMTQRAEPVLRLIRLAFTLERGLVLAALMTVGGLVVLGAVGLPWLAADFPALDRTDHGLAVVGVTLAVVGIQTGFSSFFLSLFTKKS